MVSLLLPPHSGIIPIASFCVEEGRWTARGREDARNFSAASASVPSRELKLAMKAPVPAAPTPLAPSADPSRRPASGNSNPVAETGVRQMRVWQSVRATQNNLSDNLGAQVRSMQSASSLQLALESEKLLDAQKGYMNALLPAGERDDDIVGFAFAVNGEINSADVYPSNGLFRKMWPKLLKASASSHCARRCSAAGRGSGNLPARSRSRQLERTDAARRRSPEDARGREGLSVRDCTACVPERGRHLGPPQLLGEMRAPHSGAA